MTATNLKIEVLYLSRALGCSYQTLFGFQLTVIDKTVRSARFYGSMLGNFGIILLRPSRIIVFFPLVRILNLGLPNDLQNTRGHQSKNSLSHFQSTWSKNLRNIFFDTFCNLLVNKRKIGPPNKF